MTEAFVLFVDDSRLCMMETSAVLRDHGFNVIEASSATEAFGILEGDACILALVTDVDLDGAVDGFAIARDARRLHPHLPVVYVSGTPEARHLAEGVADSEFIAKPYRRQRIIEALNRVIQLRAAA